MTSSPLIVLSLALVCSIFGTALEQTFDHGPATGSVMTSILRNHEIIHQNHIYPNMKNSRTNNFKTVNSNYDNADSNKINNIENDEIYTATDVSVTRVKKAIKEVRIKNNLRQYNKDSFTSKSYFKSKARVKRQDAEDKCDEFGWGKDKAQISHPHGKDSSNGFYYNNTNCVTVISGTDNQVIQLTFVDIFHIEHHPDCAYDFIEIRDGKEGYARSLGKFCGEVFPNQITSTGPYLWLKFHSDDTIEYEGFHINVAFISTANSHVIPEACYKDLTGMHGVVDSSTIDPACEAGSAQQALDVLWRIETPANTKIYLNFTTYVLAKPNECEENVVQVFGSVLEFPARLGHYCGSMANAVTTTEDPSKDEKGNIMYVRYYASKIARESKFNATFTAFRSLDPNKDEKCTDTEFDCEDNTCIALELKCDKYPNCRLKADEENDDCNEKAVSITQQTHIMVILVIFSLILSGMSFVFLFKCIRKLYLEHKIIKEHIRQSCEDRLDALVSSRLTLDPKQLERDSEPRASLERENHTNEMFKRQRNNFSQHKPISIDSDFIQETQLDIDDEPWRRDVDSVPTEIEQVRIERNGRSRRSDISKKEESIRKDSRSVKETISDDCRERKEIRDVSCGAPDTKESGCQTRESLFDAASPDGTESSNSGNRGFSTFGYSGATIVRPSPPAPAPAPAPATATSQITIELLRDMPPRQDSQSKKMLERRPMSAVTTRSAPDVIIVSKPIR